MRQAPSTPVRVAFCFLVLALLSLSGCGTSSHTEKKEVGTEQTVRVPQDASTITAALERVAPGGLVLVGPGTYKEKVTIATPDVTLRGTDRNKVIIDAESRRSYGVLGAADGVRIENLTTTRALLYGVLVTSSLADGEPLAQGADGYKPIDPNKFPPLQRFRIDHVTATNNGLYGIYAFNSQHGVIANSFASGSADSGIYVGQCRQCNVLVQGNVAAFNAVGFENANASDSVTITGNRFSNNRVGLTLLSDYQEAFVPQRSNVVVGNVISDNAQAATPAQADGGFGIGIGISGGRDNLIQNNLISNNPTTGVSFANTEDLPALDNKLVGNRYVDNGIDVINNSADRAPAQRNCFESGLTQAPAGLAASCKAGNQPVASRAEVPNLTVPPGLSFLDVALPGMLPSMKPDETVPTALPATIKLPNPSSVTVPSDSLLASWLQGLL